MTSNHDKRGDLVHIERFLRANCHREELNPDDLRRTLRQRPKSFRRQLRDKLSTILSARTLAPRLQWYLSGLTAGAIAVFLLFVVLGHDKGTPSVFIEIDPSTRSALSRMGAFAGVSLPVQVQFITKEQASLLVNGTIPWDSGVGRVNLPLKTSGTVLVSGRMKGVDFGGVAHVEPGISLVSLGGPYSRAKANHDQVAAIYGDGKLGRDLVSALPFEIQRTRFEGKGVIRSSLSDSVGAVFFDDVAIYDGERLIWSEDFESIPVGSYPAAPMDSIYPNPNIPMSGAGYAPKGLAVTSEHHAGAQSFLSVSVPRRARIDGIRLERNEFTTGIVRYRAAVRMNSSDGRGAYVGLKQEAGYPGNWYDKGGIYFLNGEVLSFGAGELIGTYQEQKWYLLEVTVDLPEHLMSVTLDGRQLALNIPMFSTEGIPLLLKEHPEWDAEKAREGFDMFAIGGAFYGPPEPTEGMPLEVTARTDEGTTYRLEGKVPGWRPTTIVLYAGDSLEVNASGEIYFVRPGSDRTNPDGCRLLTADPCANKVLPDPHFESLVPDVWLGSLVGRIGDGPGFLVGRTGVVVADRPGLFYLGYNDSYYADNEGDFSVTVSLAR